MANKDRPKDDGQVTNVSNLRITTRYLHSEYELIPGNLVRGETGLLQVFSIIPKSPGQPRFEARVDDGSSCRRREPDLDVDIEDVSRSVQSDFKRNRRGYQGHHTARASGPHERIFDVSIVVPQGRVFEGEVFFNVAFSVGVQAKASATASCDAIIIRGPKSPGVT